MADRAQWTGSASDLLQVGASGSKLSSARTGTGALIAQTLLTVLTQNSRPEEIARHGASSSWGSACRPSPGAYDVMQFGRLLEWCNHSISCSSFCDRLI